MTPRKVAAVGGASVPAIEQEGPVRLNPFAQKIRVPLTAEEVMDEVARTPRIYNGECSLPAHLRRDLTLRLDDFVEPLPRFFDLEARISSMIRAGYARRNPLPIAVQRRLAEEQGLDPRGYLTPRPVTLASGLSLIGFSGVGKTTAVTSVLNLHEQFHTHASFLGTPFNRTQLVWARVACPPTGGPRALLMNIFQELDRLLGTDNHRRFENSRRTAAELIPNLTDLMNNLGLGLLAIDEIQRLVRMGSEEADMLLDVFTHLRTESHTPVMLIGTPMAMQVLDSRFAQARRNTSLGRIDWQPMDNDDVWTFFVEQMWPLQWLSTPTPPTKKLHDALYDWSQGITDLAVKIFKMAQYMVIGDSEKLTPELFEAIVRTEFSWFLPWIPFLKRRAPELMSGRFDEIFEPKPRRNRNAAASSGSDLSTALLQVGVKPKDLHDVLAAVAQKQADRQAPAKPAPEPASKPKKKVKKKTWEGKTLWEIVAGQSDLSGYDSLLEAGHVRLMAGVGD